MDIYSYVESEKQFYESQHIPLVSGDDYSQYQLIRAINYARRSKYLDDNAHDDIIGDFPYDNISQYRVRLEARSTDFDLKHIEVAPEDASDEARVSALIATKALHKHLREIRFSRFLNKYADTRPEYGGVLAKKTKDGVHVVPWENVVTDMSDIMGGVIIERHYMKPAQLKKSGWNKDAIKQTILTAAEKKKEKDLKEGSDKQAQTISHLIEINEVTGELPLAMLKAAQNKEWEVDDETEYVLCRIVFAPMGKNKKTEKQEGIILQAIEIAEEDFPYKYDVRHPLTGRGLGEGIPEELSEHQRWHNFYKTEEARAVAIGGKVLFVTDDGDVVDSIFDDGIDHGTILKVGQGRMFNQLSTLPNSVPLYQAIRQDWDMSADKNTSSFDAVLGEESKAGTPFRSQYLQNMAGNSQFEREREDMGFFIQDIIYDWELQEALDKAATDDYIDEDFTKQELALIDKAIISREAVKAEIDTLRGGTPVTPELQMQLRQDLAGQLQERGGRRRIEDIKEFIKKAGERVIVHTTDEQRSKAVLFESYSNALALFAENDPARLALRDRILDQMGITTEELAMYAKEAAAMAQQLPSADQMGQPSMDTTQLTNEQSVAPVV
jgi:hypothetical protein